jgi:hypothetical protein
MDPITAIFNHLTALVALEQHIFDAAPPELQKTVAADALKFVHNLGDFITKIQDKINSKL